MIMSEDDNAILSALEADEQRDFINSELDKSLARENDPNTIWYTNEEIKMMLGL